jgi:hemoglobin/transferrin/lactoferrin receptor protein
MRANQPARDIILKGMVMAARRSRALLLACTTLLAFGIAAIAARAQTITPDEAVSETQKGDRVTPLQKIVVGKTKAANASKDVLADSPTATETTPQTIDDKQITSIEDLARSTEVGLGFDRTTGGVNLRGLQDNRILTTVDGIEIPYLLDGARGASGGVSAFDFNTLSTIDVVRGADSSRAGSGALGGALVLRTLEPEDLIDPGRTWGGFMKLGYDSTDKSIGGSAAVAKRIDNTAVLFQGGYTKGHETDNAGDAGGYGAKRSEANPADYDQRNGLFKIRQYTDAGTFGITAEHYDKNIDTDMKTLQSVTGNYRPGDDDGFEDVKRDRVSLDYKYDAESADSPVDTANAVFFLQRLLRKSGNDAYRTTSVIGDYTRDNELENRSFGFNGNASKAFETGSLHHTITFGLNADLDKTSQYSAGTDSCAITYSYACSFLHTNQSDMPDVDGKRVGVFVDDKIALGDSRLSLTPGLRFDWYDYSPEETPAYTGSANYSGMPAGQNDGRFSPKLRASYEPQDNAEIYVQWAMGFRAPSVTELYENYGVPGGYVSYGNADLKPETSNGVEIGTNLGDKDFGGHIGAYYNRYKNFIDAVQYDDTTGTYPLGITEYFNRANVRIFGLELSGHKTFDNGIHISGSLAYANGKDADSGAWIDSVAPAKAAFTIGYAKETWGTDVTLITAAKEPEKEADVFRAPGYGIVDLTGWWQPEQVKGLTLRAGVYNLFDKTYYDALNVKSATQPPEYYSEAGRAFKLTLTQRF